MVDWDFSRDPLEALQAGDPAPYEAFVHSHARLLVDFFQRRGASRHGAEDLAQDVLVKLFDHAERYRSEGRFRALVYRVAHNVWIDERRRRSVRPRLASAAAEADASPDAEGPLGREVHDGPGPEELAAVREEAARLRDAVDELPETHRAVFELGVVEELDYAEISGALEIPVGTVKSRMYHAVRKLRRALGWDETGEAPGSGGARRDVSASGGGAA